LRASVRKALAHLPSLGRAAQPQCAAGTQRQALLLVLVGFVFVRFGHALWYRPYSCAGGSGRESPSGAAGPPGAATRSPASLSRLASSSRQSLPPPTAAYTTRSRPNTAPSSLAVRISAHGKSRPG